MWPKRVELDEAVCLQMDRLIDEQHPQFATYDTAAGARYSAHDKARKPTQASQRSGGRREPPPPPPEAEAANNQTQRRSNLRGSGRLVHLTVERLVLAFCQFCHLSADDASQPISYRCTPAPPPPCSEARDRSRRPQRRRPCTAARVAGCWPHLISALHCACMLAVAGSLYHHYVYDYYRLHLRRLRQARAARQEHILADYSQLNWTEARLERGAARARQSLDALGAPFLGAAYAPECCYLYLLITALSVHLLFRAYLRLAPGPVFDLHLLRLLLNRNNERKNLNRLICAECNKFLQSACNFAEGALQRCLALNGPSAFRLEAESRLARQLRDHERTIRALTRMALAGELQPGNKTDGYLDAFERHYCAALVGLSLVGFGFSYVAMRWLPRLSRGGAPPFEMRLDRASDLWASLELVLMWSVITLEAIFYVSFTLANCVDQILLIRRLADGLARCMAANARLFYGNSLSVPHDWRRHQLGAAELMNRRLLACLLHYKLFVAKLKTIQRSFAPLCLCMLANAFTLPVVARLHVPYMSPHGKLYVIAISLSVFLLSNICLTACCLLNVQCLKLYRRLWALLAHTIELTSSSQQQQQLVSRSRVYDEHTVWMLRKELHHSGQLTDQFATSALGIRFNFATLFRLYFWFGLIIVSILVDANSTAGAESQESHQELALMGSLARDPLGLYDLAGRTLPAE